MTRPIRPLPLALASTLVSIAALAPAARAASDDVDLRSFRPTPDRNASLATEGIDAPGPWNLQFASWFVFDTASVKVNDPVPGTGTTQSLTPVGSRLLIEPTVNLGIGRRAAFGLSLPFVPIQAGEASSLTDGAAMPAQAIGDLSLYGKAVAISPDPDMGGLGLAFVARGQLPTGSKNAFISDSAAIVEARALVLYDLGHLLLLTGTAGYRLRFNHHDVTDVTIGDAIPWGATLSLKPRGLGLDDKGHWTWSLEGHGDIAAGPMKFLSSSRVSPVLLGASARYEINKDFSLFFGLETGVTAAIGSPRLRGVLGITYAPTVLDEDHDGVPDDVDECPGLPEDGKGEHPHDGCPDYESEQTGGAPPPPPPPPVEETPAPPPPPPAPADTDGDGITDDVDKCPDQPETKNGYEDEDGCPELDKDNDTFLDAVDKCPDEPETFNGYQDDDGCPDEAPAKKGEKKPASLVAEVKGKAAPAALTIRTLAFEGNEPKDAQGDLRAVAAWLLAHPGLHVRVAVKPEGKGDDAAKVASARANAIASALVRFAHTGAVAEAAPWDAKSGAKGNVSLAVVEAPKSEGKASVGEPPSAPPPPPPPPAPPSSAASTAPASSAPAAPASSAAKPSGSAAPAGSAKP